MNLRRWLLRLCTLSIQHRFTLGLLLLIAASYWGNLARWTVIQADHAVSDFMLEFMPSGMLGDDPIQQAHHQRAIAAGIASGAAEIQLNLAARRFLELPSETSRGL